MKNKSTSRIANLFSRIINIRLWFDMNRMKATTDYLSRGLRRLFVPPKKGDAASFAAVVASLNMTEAQLQEQVRGLLRLCKVMLGAAFLIFCYMGYQLVYGSYRATFLSLIVLCIALVLAFRYHFWAFQIQQRSLGCSIRQWYRQSILGEKS